MKKIVLFVGLIVAMGTTAFCQTQQNVSGYHFKPDSIFLKKVARPSLVERIFKKFGNAFAVDKKSIQKRDETIWNEQQYSNQQRLDELEKNINAQLALQNVLYGIPNYYPITFNFR